MAHVRSLFFEGAASESEHRAIAAAREGRITSVIWNITNQCNLRCNHCYMAADGHTMPNELTDEETMNLVERLSQDEVPVVFISGGEPMVRKNFWEILEGVAAAGVRPTVSTNCTMITEESAARLAENGVRWIATSLYGAEQFHDDLVGIPGTHAKVIDAIKTLRKHDVGVVIKTALNRDIWPHIFETIQTAKDLDCGLIYICDLITSGRSEGEDDQRISVAQWRELCDFIVEDMLDPTSKLEYDIGAIPSVIPYMAQRFTEKGMDVAKGLERLQVFSACPVGGGHMTINSQGGVMACQFAQDWTVGNIRDMELCDAAAELAKIRTMDSEGQCAPEVCDYSHICRGCRVKAWQRTGNTMGEDLTCILSSEERKYPDAVIGKISATVAPCQGSCG